MVDKGTIMFPEDAPRDVPIGELEQYGVRFPDAFRYTTIAQWQELARLILPVEGSPVRTQLEEMNLQFYFESDISEAVEDQHAPFWGEVHMVGKDVHRWFQWLTEMQPIFEAIPSWRERRVLPWTNREELGEQTGFGEAELDQSPESPEEAWEEAEERSERELESRVEEYREQWQRWYGPDDPTTQ